jgi:hypothetical protein
MTDGEHRDSSPPPLPVEGDQPAVAPPPPPVTPGRGGAGYGPPPVPPADRIQAAWQRRDETDYIFDYWTALGWTILTLGIYSFYVFYQLVRRMRDHIARRIELFDAALAFAWEEAGQRDLRDELTPSFQRANAHMDVLRRMTSDFREPAIWLVLAFVARGIVEIIAFVLLDQDLVKHDRSEMGVEYELSVIFGRFGRAVPGPDQTRVKGPDNYVGRIVATIFTLGIYLFWWYYNQMDEPNRHFRANWAQEDALVAATRGAH